MRKMNNFEYEDWADCSIPQCYKMAHYVTDSGDYLCSEHAHKHLEWKPELSPRHNPDPRKENDNGHS